MLDARGMHVLPGAIDVHVIVIRYPHKRGFRERYGGCCFRRCHNRVRHAEHHSADRHA
jgi:hypothetical protein